MKRVASTRVSVRIVGLALLVGVLAGGPAIAADDPLPAYAPVKTADEALARIQQLGGRVSRVSDSNKALVVDLRFSREGVRDEHLQYILRLDKVVSVKLKRVAVTDAGMKHLASVASIEELDLSETRVTGAGLSEVARLPRLRSLNLFGTVIDDRALKHLEKSKTLRRVFLDQTRTTVAGVAALRAANSQLQVIPDRPATAKSLVALVRVSKKLLAEAESVLAGAEKLHKELTPQLGQLQKAEETTKSELDAAKKALDASNKAAAEAKKLADDLQAKLKEAQAKYAEAQKQAVAAKAMSAAKNKAAKEAKARHARAKKAKPAFELAQRVRDASLARLADARRRQVVSPGVPFAPNQQKLPVAAPEGAVVLFGGGPESKFLSKTGGPIDWPIDKGELESTKGGNNSNHIVSAVHFRDAVIHVEFQLPPKGAGNSGVYIHGNYELQIIRSHGKKDVTQKDMGALYGFAKPLVNAARKPGEWQGYDILFEAPRRDDKQKIVKKGSITAWLNGKLVQDRTQFGEPRSVYHPYRHETTPYLKAIFERQKKTMVGPVFLQDHGHKVRFRNVWILPLDDKSGVYTSD